MNPYSKCLKYIANASDPKRLYDDIRRILSEAGDRDYPEDHQIKRLQRLADAKHKELTARDEPCLYGTSR